MEVLMMYAMTVLCVKDLEKSKKFYYDLFGLTVEEDFGTYVSVTKGLAFQLVDSWQDYLGKREPEIVYKNHASKVVFEIDNFDEVLHIITTRNDIELVHPIIHYSWRRRVVRFYDPDGHIVEVGESMDIVVKRFISSGLTAEEAANRIETSVDSVNDSLERSNNN